MITLYNDDCLNILKSMDDNSIDSCVTDPPYGLSFMGKSWDYDVPKKEIWEQVFRVLKPGAHLLAFFGSRTYHRGVVQIEDAGFEIRDQIMWIYGSGFPKSLNVGKAIDKDAGATRTVKKGIKPGHEEFAKEEAKQWEGWGTALKPAHEPIVVARKPITQTVSKNVLEYGTGALNIDGCRVPFSKNDDERIGKDYKHSASADFKVSDGKDNSIGKEINLYKNQGRWPANIIHDGSDEVVSQFPQTGSGNNKQPYSYTGREYNNKDTSMFNGDKPQAPFNYNDSGSASRFFYCAKASKSDRDEGLDMLSDKQNCGSYQFGTDSSLDGKSTKDRKNNHPTVKPTELMKYLCKLVTPPNGIILDPFMGSGSTGKAALQEGFKFVGIEMNKEYFDIALKRIKIIEKDNNLLNFFTREKE